MPIDPEPRPWGEEPEREETGQKTIVPGPWPLASHVERDRLERAFPSWHREPRPRPCPAKPVDQQPGPEEPDADFPTPHSRYQGIP
jgi:hypothetical protein